MVFQVLLSLTSVYRTFRSLVQHSSFDSLRSMLVLEEHINNKDKSPSHDSALVVTQCPKNSEFLEHMESRPNSNNRDGRRPPRRGGRNHHSHQFQSQQQQHGV